MKKLVLVMFLLFAFMLIADDVEVKLNGATSTQMFSVQDNTTPTPNKLFIVKGHGVVTMPTHATAPAGTAGDMYYNSANAKVYYHDGSNWIDMTAAVIETDPTLTDDGLVTIGDGSTNPVILTFTSGATGNGTIEWDDSSQDFGIPNGGVCIGGTLTTTNLEVIEGNTDTTPALFITQAGTGDAAEKFSLMGIQDFSIGIHNNDNDNFKICDAPTLTGTIYTDPTTMMRIHTENLKPGIIDFNHQSRARVYLSTSQSIPLGLWTMINFDATTYDEHVEFGNPTTPTFTALEDGYYQVNARTDFVIIEGLPQFQGYVSIAIYVNGNMYAQGNKLQGVDSSGEPLTNNLAPNVSDVVELFAGQRIEIHVLQTLNNNVFLVPGSTQTYVSIHKSS